MREPVSRNGYALVASIVVTSALGGLFWVLAARRYDAHDVGVNASLISMMVFLGNVAHLNLTNLLNRFVPTAGPDGGRTIVWRSYLVAVGLAVVAAVVFLLGLAWWAPSLRPVLDEPELAVGFVVASAAWVVFVLQDSVLAGLSEGVYVLGENVVYAVVKLVLLLALAATLPDDGVFLAWVLPLPVLVLAVNLLAFRVLIPRQPPATAEIPSRSTVVRFLGGDYVSSLVWTATATLLPVLVLEHSGAEASAYVFTAWTIAYTLYLVSRSMGMAMTTAGAREPSRLRALARRTMWHTARMIVPVVAVVVVGAPLILRLFGRDYASGASTLLRLFALSAVPYIVTSTFLCVARVQHRIRAVVVVTTAMSVLTLALSIALLLWLGVVGVGIAWLVGQSVVAAVLLVTEFRAMTVGHMGVARVAAIVSGARALTPANRSGPIMRDARELMERTDLDRHWNLIRLISAHHDVGLFEVRARDGSVGAVLRTPRSPAGERGFVRHARALMALQEKPQLDGWRQQLLPAIIAEDVDGSPRWLIEELKPGRAANDMPVSWQPELCRRTVHALAPLHRATATEVRIDAALLDAWVDVPLERLQHRDRAGGPRHVEEIARVRDVLHADLADCVVPASFVHGDLWLGNVLVDPESRTVHGVIDWDQAREPDIPYVDIAHLIVATRADTAKRSIGAVVLELVRTERFAERELSLLGLAGLGPCPLRPRTIVLLAWLRHVSGLLDKSERYNKSFLWRAQNAEHVLERV